MFSRWFGWTWALLVAGSLLPMTLGCGDSAVVEMPENPTDLPAEPPSATTLPPPPPPHY
jgi:hypothetical protein